METELARGSGRPAGFWLRVLAKLADFMLLNSLGLLFLGLLAVLHTLGASPVWLLGAVVLAVLLITVGYFTIFWSGGRQTLGYRLAGLQVASLDQQPVGVWRSLWRTIWDLIFLNLTLGWVTFLPIAITRSKRAVHDWLSGTKVMRVAAPRYLPLGLCALSCLALSIVGFFGVVRPFFIQAYYIPSGAMEPTLSSGPPNDRILVNKFLYRFRAPRRQDIVVFIAPERVTGGERKDYLKRLIGLPGDLIEIHDGAVYANGKPLNEPYLGPENRPVYYWPLVKIQGGQIYTRPSDYGEEFDGPVWPVKRWIGKPYEELPEQLQGVWEADLTRDGPIRVPAGCYFVLGDNRNNSNDSHRWGFLKKERVLGQVMLTFWPPVRQDDYGRRRWNIRSLDP